MVKDKYMVLGGITELSKYKAGNEFIREIFIHYRNNQTLYSSKGSTSMDVVIKNSDIIMYMIPLPINGSFQNSVAIFVIYGISIRNMISEGRTEFNGTIYVLDAGKNILLSANKVESSSNRELAAAVIKIFVPVLAQLL